VRYLAEMPTDVTGTPYYLSNGAGAEAIRDTIQSLTERVDLLRAQGRLTESTLLQYYGEKRFEQIAESNAIEGSTLSVGETELAVLKGITIAGHDPAYARDAKALADAFEELTRMAKVKQPTDIEQVQKLQGLILGERPGAGVFRSTEVRIRGAHHKPPKTWREVMDQMDQWQTWSIANASAPCLLRAAVLHAWLEHIHPFLDGNGRTGRAITNLELVRAGYPPIIIRRKDRDRYLDALARADEGELGEFVEIIAGRMDDALRDLERAAQARQGYDAQAERVRKAQGSRLSLWNAGVHLLLESVKSNLLERLADPTVEVEAREYDQLSVDDFIELCEGRPVRLSWAFVLRCRIPGMPPLDRLAWAGVVNEPLKSRLASEPGRPVLMWSLPNASGYPPWVRAHQRSPGGEQMTIFSDRWLVARDGHIQEYSPGELASKIVEDILEESIPSPRL
jgi:Fic family protein